jgi:hypothetical protein
VALQIHLEQAVLGMDKSKREGRIQIIGGGYGGDAGRVAIDPYWREQASYDPLLAPRRQRRAEP